MRYTIGFVGTMFFLAVVSLAGWLNHVIHTINHEEWLLLLAGAILAPIGVIHGIGLWFGIF